MQSAVQYCRAKSSDNFLPARLRSTRTPIVELVLVDRRDVNDMIPLKPLEIVALVIGLLNTTVTFRRENVNTMKG